MTDCIFCRIANGEIPTSKVAESEKAFAFRDTNPQAPTHVLVIPKAHVTSLATADSETLGAVMHLAAQVANQEGIEESGYRTVLNTGKAAGQTVHHLHAHVLGGRDLHWPPG